MAQKPRTTHPSDAQDERLARLPLPSAYSYAYLPTVLDDEGRVADQPAVLNGYLWPLRADEHPTAAMADDLAALVDAGLLCRYSDGGHDYLHDPRWKQRQRPVQGEPSVLPPCPTHDKPADDLVSETLHKVSEQVSAFLGSAGGFDEAKIRDTVSRLVEDVTFLVDPDKASAYGQKVREFLTGTVEPATSWPPEPDIDPGRRGTDVWEDVTDRPRPRDLES